METPNTQPQPTGQTSQDASKTLLVSVAIGLGAAIFLGLVFFIFGTASPIGFGWYIFSFAAGITMIVLPCTLPLAFVIVPLSMGKGAKRGLAIAAAFGLGVSLTLSVYGILAALLGKLAIGSLGAPLEVVKNWLYFVAGTFAYLFALGELGLVNFHMPTYSGAAPAFIQKQKDILKALMLGLFLGNVGIGCPHPATPFLLTRIAVAGDVFYGWSLFFVHAVGRVLPLVLLAVLAILGINGLNWLVKRKDKIERATGWGMVFVAGFILVLGLFSHDWWVYSGQHTLLEAVTQEEFFLNAIGAKLGTGNSHQHGIPAGLGLFGLPLWLGNWVLVLLWIVPFWWNYNKMKKAESALAEPEKSSEQVVRPYRFDFYITLSVLLFLVFVWFLPERFRAQNGIPPGGSMAAMPGHSMAMGPVMVHEAKDIKSGISSDMNISPVPVRTGDLSKISFLVNEKPQNAPVPSGNLQIVHEKLMHIIGVRSDMDGFFHIHPDAVADTPGLFSVNHIFNKPGRYKLWSEFTKDGTTHVVGEPEVTVVGAGVAENKQVSFDRVQRVDNFQITLGFSQSPVQKQNFTFNFDIHALTGPEVPLDNFLGAPMHLSVIKDDWSQFIHTHPNCYSPPVAGLFDLLPLLKPWLGGTARADGAHTMSTSGCHGVGFATVFPEPGLYRVYAQFHPKGINLPADQALMASFWIKVEEKAAFPVSSWWLLLIVSAILIAILSAATKKFLEVK